MNIHPDHLPLTAARCRPRGVPLVRNCVRLLLSLAWLSISAGARAQFHYSIQDNEVTITDYSGFDLNVEIPETLEGLPVTRIGPGAFQSPLGLATYTNVIIPETVVEIGPGAFSESLGLRHVRIPNRVTIIGAYAFFSCFQLESVSLGNGLTNIGDLAFNECSSLREVVLPDSLVSIGDSAFASCTRITSVTIPAGVSSIGANAFDGCVLLTDILTDPLNASFSSLGGVLFNKDQSTLLRFPMGKFESYTIPMGVANIGAGAFHQVSGLTNVFLPSTVTNLGTVSFAGCPNLTNVSLPSGLAQLGDGAFYDCPKLSAVVIPRGITTLGDHAFSSCESLATVQIPPGVTNIGNYAFAFCPSLQQIGIPASVGWLANTAFHLCPGLTGLYFSGNAPALLNQTSNSDPGAFYGTPNVVIYYAAGAEGWESTFGGRPTVLWNPVLSTTAGGFGAQSGRFGITIISANDLVVVVEVAGALDASDWIALGTNTLTGGSFYFEDPEWAGHPARFYRLRSP